MREWPQKARHLFTMTVAHPCPYIEGRLERDVVADLNIPNAQGFYDWLLRSGFRRVQHMAYRPACPGCNACVPVRINVNGFRISRNLREVQRRNRDVTERVLPAKATQEQYQLFMRYQTSRHAEGEMATMDFADYRMMVEESPLATNLVEYRTDAGELVAVCLTDQVRDGLSGVYKFFSPRHGRRSLGTLTILRHIERARSLGLPYFYLGYWIGECRKMSYKQRFQPLEALVDGTWRHFDAVKSRAAGQTATGIMSSPLSGQKCKEDPQR